MADRITAVLLVPGLDVDLAHDLAVAHLQHLGTQDSRPVRILAGLLERYAILTDDLVLDAVGHLP